MQSYSVKPHLCNRVEDLIPETAKNLAVDTGYLQRHERKKETEFTILQLGCLKITNLRQTTLP